MIVLGCIVSNADFLASCYSQVVVNGASLLPTQNFDGTVYTFGFGADHDARMLEALSTEGGGVYYYIDSADKVRYWLITICTKPRSICSTSLCCLGTGPGL